MKAINFIISAATLIASTIVLPSCSSRVYERAAAYTKAQETAAAQKAGADILAATDLSDGYTWMPMSSTDRAYSLLTDDVVASNVRGQEATFPVIIEEAIEKPGMYRLVNPMKAFDKSGSAETAYIVIDATNPNRVFIDKQNVGVNLGKGELAIESAGARYQALGEDPLLIEDARYYGKLENGIISFPRSQSLNLWTGKNSSRSDLSGSFRIVLPEKVAEVERGISKADYALGVEYIARVAGNPAIEINPATIPADSYALSE